MKIYVDESQDLEMVYFNALVRTQDKYGFDLLINGVCRVIHSIICEFIALIG